MQQRQIFRPAVGQAHAKYVAAYLNNTNASGVTASYRGDVVVWDTTAPTSQGASGVLDGQTLGATDFIYVTPTTTATDRLPAGYLEGRTVGDTVTSVPLVDDTLIVVQIAGLFRNHAWVLNAGAARQVLNTHTVSGQSANAAATTNDDGAITAVQMNAVANYTRDATQSGCTIWVKCDH